MYNKNINNITNLFCLFKFKLPNSLNLCIETIKIHNKIVLLIQNTKNKQEYKYIVLPSFFKLFFENNVINFLFLNKKQFHSFYKIFLELINNSKIFYKQLSLKGSGYRFVFFSKTKTLELKLGFTHKKYVALPFDNSINIVMQKPTLILLSFNFAQLGNFSNSIKKTKIPNSYTGRGFWNLKDKQKLKVIKKQ